jgi:uncharacterized membrane protein YedE/YeeE
MQILMAFILGLIFGLGLIISGMTNPSKVIGFLDIFGGWDPSLALVMVGAISVAFVGFRCTAKQSKSVFGCDISLPTKSQPDIKLIIGSLVFGAGWGLAGFCPGPALTSLLSGGIKPLAFTAAMVVGMVIIELQFKLYKNK